MPTSSLFRSFSLSFIRNRIASEVRYMSLRVLPTASAGTLSSEPYFCYLVADVLHQHCERRIGAFADRVLGDILGHRRARIADDAVPGALGGNHRRGGGRGLLELRHLRFRQRAVQRISRRHGADQDQHDQAHALLTVVRTVREADTGAGQDQEAANPQRRRLVAFRRGVQRRIADDHLQQQQQNCSADKARPAATAAARSRFRSPCPSRRRMCRRGRASAHWQRRRR